MSRRAICRRARTPHEPTQDERHTGRDRTTNEQLTNTHAPARQASRESTRPVASPCEVRHKPVSCPWEGRKKSVICPCEVRSVSVARPWIARCMSVTSRFLSVAHPSGARVQSVICPPFSLSGRNERQRMESAQSAARRKLVAKPPRAHVLMWTLRRPQSHKIRRAARRPPAAAEEVSARECNPLHNCAPPSASALMPRRQSPSPAMRFSIRHRRCASP